MLTKTAAVLVRFSRLLPQSTVFPASLTKLVFVDWKEQPSFSFTKDLIQKASLYILNLLSAIVDPLLYCAKS